MELFEEFKKWLDATKDYTKPTKSNIVSRLKRANSILEITDDPLYLYRLSNSPEFGKLTVSVRSQVRRAVKLYYEYKESVNDNL